MPTSLPPIGQALLSGLQQARTEQISSLTRLLDLTIGSTTMALVEKVAPITPDQRDFLLAQQKNALTLLNQQPPSAAVKIQLTTLQDQQLLLNSPLLKLAELIVNGRNLLTYTDQPLQPGQQIPVKVDAQQRLLQLLPFPITDKNSAANANPEKLTSPTIDPAARLKTEQALADVLRTLLPQKDKPQELFTTLAQLLKLPGTRKDQLISTNVQIALKRIAEQLRAPDQLGNPKILATTLKNSGVQFEHKLATHFATQTLSAGTSTIKNPAIKTTTDHSQVTRLATQDLKGALLHLLHRVSQDITREHPHLATSIPSATGTEQTVSPATTSQLTSISAAQLTLIANEFPTPTFHQLLQQMSQHSRGELSDKVLRTQLLLLLHQHTLTSLAKVQLQQLHTVNHQQSQLDSPQPTQSWLLEIPVKHGQDFHKIDLRIDQEWVDDEKTNENSTDKKTKQWSVMLSFDLPKLGGFHTQLIVLNETVSAKIWAEHEATLDQAQQKLSALRQQLQAQGVEVKQLECIKGTPPSKAISLRYALVDITT